LSQLPAASYWLIHYRVPTAFAAFASFANRLRRDTFIYAALIVCLQFNQPNSRDGTHESSGFRRKPAEMRAKYFINWISLFTAEGWRVGGASPCDEDRTSGRPSQATILRRRAIIFCNRSTLSSLWGLRLSRTQATQWGWWSRMSENPEMGHPVLLAGTWTTRRNLAIFAEHQQRRAA
jgi:hypothetical protein